MSCGSGNERSDKEIEVRIKGPEIGRDSNEIIEIGFPI